MIPWCSRCGTRRVSWRSAWWGRSWSRRSELPGNRARVQPLAQSAPARARPASPVGVLARYVLFAIVATLANLLTQELVFQLVAGLRLSLSILAGTAVGFAVKYVLDKKW